jgi:CheY-like chemotaxis protein
MSDEALAGRRILIVEDGVFVADSLKLYLEQRGAVVVGPAGTVPEALELIRGPERLDWAIVDLDLKGKRAYSVADALAALDVKFVFVTGYGPEQIPARFAAIPRRTKPFDSEELVRLLGG